MTTTKPPGLWNTPAYWNGSVYLWGNEQWPMMFSMNNGVLSTTPTQPIDHRHVPFSNAFVFDIGEWRAGWDRLGASKRPVQYRRARGPVCVGRHRPDESSL